MQNKIKEDMEILKSLGKVTDTEEFDISCQDYPTCPHCGFQEIEIGEIDDLGQYDGDICRTQCSYCEGKFQITTHVTYSYSTEKIDKVAEEAEKQRRETELQEKVKQARAFTPGMKVRLKKGRSPLPDGAIGIVANKEPFGTTVRVEFTGTKEDYVGEFYPKYLEIVK